MALVNYWKGGFGGRRDAAKAEFPEESTWAFSRKPAPKVLETSKIDPARALLANLNARRSSAFIGG